MRTIRIVLPILVFAAGIAVLTALVRTKPEAKKVAREDPGTLVEVVEVAPERQRVAVRAQGTVMPSRQVALAPEVSGVVTWAHPELAPGGRFQKGERLIRIDPRDYQLAVEKQLAAVDGALTELQLEKSRKKVAEREWELFEGKKPTDSDQGESLALREPQLRTAKVALESAKSGLQQAKLAVTKTQIKAPFNAMVQAENVEPGQMVGPSAPILTLVGTDAYWVQVSVPADRISWIAVPGVRGLPEAAEGAEAKVLQDLGRGQTVERTGRVIRLLADVDPAGRMARLLIRIDDPLALEVAAAGLEQPTPAAMPLLLGSFVEVEIEGREVDEVVAIQREALRDGDQVYLITKDGKLEKRPVSVIWRRQESVLVDRGLEAGDKVIVSPVPAPVDGMKLRIADKRPKKNAKRADKRAGGSR